MRSYNYAFGLGYCEYVLTVKDCVLAKTSDRSVKDITLLGVLASKDGIKHVQHEHPDLKVGHCMQKCAN
jgi:uracil phosphoribosyltransferase